VVLGGCELLAVGLFMIGFRLSLAEAFLYVMYDIFSGMTYSRRIK
jgi:hypothetical protein